MGNWHNTESQIKDKEAMAEALREQAEREPNPVDRKSLENEASRKEQEVSNLRNNSK